MGRCLGGEKVTENGGEKSESADFRTQHRVFRVVDLVVDSSF